MPTTEPDVHVAVGILIRDRQVLIAQRLPHQHLAGLWEFPGGKLEDGESVRSALVRELQEELGIRVGDGVPLSTVTHHYPGKTVHLDCWVISEFSGEPKGMEGQPVKWVSIDQLGEYSFPEANRKIYQRVLDHLA